jgi:hypothetical protein
VNRTIASLWPLILGACFECCHASSNVRPSNAIGSEAAGAGGVNDASPSQTGDGDAGLGGAAGNGVRALFNGVSFENWDRYLGKPFADAAPLGLENDPHGVYSIVMADGEPAIRISGQDWGSLISQQEFCDFDLRAEYKWGTLVWPPLESQDSGMMLLSTGPLGAVNAGGNALSDPVGSGGFMVSLEYQIAPGNVGAFYNLGPITFSTSYVAGPERADTWNQVEIIHQHGEATSFLNGQQVSQASAIEIAWPQADASALSCGKLQLQSEGAEILFRHVEIQTLP